MNLQSLRFFYEAFQYNSLTEASKHLHISQPALTKHIKNLEKEFHVTLVKKSGRQIELTNLGKQLFDESAILFSQEKQIESLLTKQTNTYLTIGTTQLNSEYLMKSLLLESEKTTINLSFMIENTQTLFEKLEKNLIDFAILPEISNPLKFKRDYLFTDYLIFVAHPDYCPDTLSKKEIANYQFIKHETGSFLQTTLEQNKDLLPIFSVEVTGQSNALIASQLKQGIYLTSYTAVKDLIFSEKLKEVQIENISFEPRDFYLYSSKTPNSQSIKNELISKLKKKPINYD
ncbi:LysR family transcriptional regulator [Vagococcus fluvialis]|uniref:LysR family transcriptional regulator n=1 Tax=Vagococcus fluvialis TaxID=2738 RepID=UPI001A8DC217|nr:LysR family transcriptional regulator [Vagococcus fluvialis]MBO0444142.1 LysR family transcriptional regulator [Vagococcus fluvialis]